MLRSTCQAAKDLHMSFPTTKVLFEGATHRRRRARCACSDSRVRRNERLKRGAEPRSQEVVTGLSTLAKSFEQFRKITIPIIHEMTLTITLVSSGAACVWNKF